MAYFVNRGSDEIFWFGNWPQFWRETGNPVAFGVNKEAPPTVRKAFAESYKGAKVPFDDGNGEYAVGWVSKDELSAPDSVERVWNQIKPVLEAVTKAGEDAERSASAAT
jgi:hypothetical protein